MIRTNRSRVVRTAAGVMGGLMLAGVGAAAMADEVGTDGVDVNVTIDEQAAGALSLSVAADSETLTEVEDASPDYREFVGALPDVTVTDTRSEVPEGVYWYVTGQASDFVGSEGQDPITPDHLGWAPALVTEGNGEVAPGEEVPTSLDDSTNPDNPNNVGLAGEELLQLALDSAEATAANGSWTANADLTLKTPNDVAGGSYSSTVTLSLFEEAY
ncbi:MAG: hypothetical protein ACTH2J_04965 [Candidatus Microbacterium stercoravium]|uniref:WxL domain-containing protein n=1 Tax=Candidatus Microbacterium stercoravium TaxID=2838697 RepID=A0A9D2H3T1_9MICO|nr:hypothetical protein [Candidatus Microbacterium stercoravium]